MKQKRIWALAAVFCFCGSLQHALAQTDLTGSVYENPDIMGEEMKKLVATIDSRIDSIRMDAIEKKEKEAGRKLTPNEMAQLEEQIQEAQKMMIVMQKAMKTSVSVEFTSAKDVIMRVHMEINDDALKKGGVSWMRRKAMKAALSMMPEKQKATYEVMGDLIITFDGSERDTMRISKDRKFLYGKLDERQKFTLTRKK